MQAQRGSAAAASTEALMSAAAEVVRSDASAELIYASVAVFTSQP